MKKTYNVTGMGCSMCSQRIENGIRPLKGIKECNVNLALNSMVVDFDEKVISSKDIMEKVTELGYGATEEEEESDPSRNKSEKELRLRLIVSLIFGVPLFLFSMVPFFQNFLIDTTINLIVKIILVFPIVFVNFNVYKSGFLAVKNKAPNMDTLVSIGTIASILILYFDSAGMILTIVTLGKWIEEKAKKKTGDSIEGLSKLVPTTCTKYIDNIEKVVETSTLKKGDIVIVHPGESIPCDGIVIEGNSHTNNSIITGESEKIEVKKNSKVITGTINIEGYLKIKVSETGKNTLLGKIIKMVVDATSTKAPIARIADKVSVYLVPSVIGVSILTFIIWMIISRDFTKSFNYAISVIVITCPCALGLATPLSIMVGTGRGIKEGVLIKSAESLENLGKTDLVVFDKTGTITRGIVEDKVSLEERLDGDKKIVDTTNDSIKLEAKEVISELNDLGINVVLLSGDKKANVNRIANEVGISKFYAEVLPNEKDKIIKELKKEHKIVTMVGDGVNDAIAITESDIGISLSSGTDIAIDSADIVLLNDNLKDIIYAINLSKATIKNIKGSLFWAFFYNIIFIPMAAGCYGIMLSPMISATLMSISSITVVMNALRLRKTKIVK